VTRNNSSLIALPADSLKISCTSADDRGIHTQHLSLTIDPDVYITQIAAARTFTIYEDIEELIKLGKIKGAAWTARSSSRATRSFRRNRCVFATSLCGTRFSTSSATWCCSACR